MISGIGHGVCSSPWLDCIALYVKIKAIYIRFRDKSTLQWVGHVVRMDKSRLPRRLLTAWVREPRPEFGQQMSYGRSLERWLKLFDLPLRYTEWATLALSLIHI